MSTPEELLCKRGWRLRHSAWMLWGILSLGVFWVVGFAYIGFRARNRTWLLIAAGFLVYTIASFTVSALGVLPSKGEPSTPLSSAYGGVTVLFWAGGGVLAWFTNRKWLVWRAHHSKKAAWYTTATATGAAPVGQLSPAVMVDDALRAPQPLSTPPAAAPPPLTPRPSAAAVSAAAPPPPGTLYAPGAPSPTVDINSATHDQLAALPGLDAAWADHIIATRTQLGGFADPAELVTKASLAPHVFASIRGRVTATPIFRPPAPGAAKQPPDGRRLEF